MNYSVNGEALDEVKLRAAPSATEGYSVVKKIIIGILHFFHNAAPKLEKPILNIKKL